ncbi:CinA-like protein [Marivirga tractuosa]|uniref:CinA-like protein n=1 Tax=Marivirga tractuosa (strain ATCC 23168 / DSM 4126 / NBRC 15989 / NCIMB 1408 / VKM B-1430 / H-43) TaxID=643867 RepID=E4TPX3_MARTH|nr:competence/damage-inducible protein A [Marivirga tractuosa]ADR20530.1 competence/damage-inducible protein cinA [Marivirga tractuosa DSM 4126]BDD15022.1 CinA-like protein [Marivirga tractuosa]
MMQDIYAELISIGDEILYGQTLDTNSHFISAELDKLGIRVKRKVTVADNREAMMRAFKEAESNADLIIITGGLGPTKDDLTKPLLAEYFDCGMRLHEDILEDLKQRFAKRGRELNELNKGQAELPEKCQPIENKYGTAPGMWFEKDGKVFISMPGVPKEMKYMMEDTIIPKFKEIYKAPVLIHKMVKTVGIQESILAERLEDWENNLPQEIKLAYLPGLNQVKLRLTASGVDEQHLQNLIHKEVEKLYELIGKYIYGTDDTNLPAKIGELLKEKALTIACAESCTGGYIAHLFTSNAGSSEYYRGGINPYHNDLKINILGVKKETIEQHGAVSKETVIEMAERVRELFGADIGISTSGIAGPGGATKEKPVGTTWVALADGMNTQTKLYHFQFDRQSNIEITSNSLLNLVRQTLSSK